MTVARTWRAKIHSDRTDDYLTFLEGQSRPMFRALPGCLGAVFLRDGDDVTVVSVWADGSAVEALSTNSLYAKTVAALESSGILASTEGAKVHNCDGFIVRSEVLMPDR